MSKLADNYDIEINHLDGFWRYEFFVFYNVYDEVAHFRQRYMPAGYVWAVFKAWAHSLDLRKKR